MENNVTNPENYIIHDIYVLLIYTYELVVHITYVPHKMSMINFTRWEAW
jgi:hypothetical protein